MLTLDEHAALFSHSFEPKPTMGRETGGLAMQEHLCEMGWLRPCEGGYAITPEGREALRREQARCEP